MTPIVETSAEPPRLVCAQIEGVLLTLPLWYLENYGTPALWQARLVAKGLSDARLMLALVRVKNRTQLISKGHTDTRSDPQI